MAPLLQAPLKSYIFNYEVFNEAEFFPLFLQSVGPPLTGLIDWTTFLWIDGD